MFFVSPAGLAEITVTGISMTLRLRHLAAYGDLSIFLFRFIKSSDGLVSLSCENPPSTEMNLPLKLLPVLLPNATAWAEREERKILRHGIPLTPEGLLDARRWESAIRKKSG